MDDFHKAVQSAKNAVVSEGLHTRYYRAKGHLFRDDPQGVYMQMLKDDTDDVVFAASRLVSESLKARKTRAQHKVAKWVTSGWSYFLTLTFNDDCLARTSASTRRQLVTRFLNSFGTPYMANIDFGGKNGREHYHAIIYLPCVGKPDFSVWSRNGFYQSRHIRPDEGDSKAVAKYVCKLTNHAFKPSTTGSGRFVSQRIIYGKARFVEVPPKWLVED